MALIDQLSLEALASENRHTVALAVNALMQLVEAPGADGPLVVIKDAAAWVHTAFYTYRSAMADNDPGLPRLARIEHDFIAALVALNFDDQQRQLRQALLAILAFPKPRL